MSENVPLPGEFVLLIDHLAEAPITATQLKAWIAKDPFLTKVHTLKWLAKQHMQLIVNADIKSYFVKRWELTKLDRCIIWCS